MRRCNTCEFLLITDVFGTVQSRAAGKIKYMPHGYSIPHGVSQSAYKGVWQEARSGIYLSGQGVRSYGPVLMRFHQSDPTSPFRQGGVNSYAYCHANAVNLIDPSGLMPMPKWITKLIGQVQKLRPPTYRKLSDASRDPVSTSSEMPLNMSVSTSNPSTFIQAHQGPPVDRSKKPGRSGRRDLSEDEYRQQNLEIYKQRREIARKNAREATETHSYIPPFYITRDGNRTTRRPSFIDAGDSE